MPSFRFVSAAPILLALALLQPAIAQPSESEKELAVDRYLRVMPMSKMMEDTYSELAKQLPMDARTQFIADMRSTVDVPKIEQITKAALVRNFTLEELNALADFYSSKHGASAMAKFGTYMGDVLPPLMQEVQRATQERQKKGKR